MQSTNASPLQTEDSNIDKSSEKAKNHLNEHDPNSEKNRIEPILRKINSKSNKFQIQTLVILGAIFVVFGIQDLNIDYVYMSPKFICTGGPEGTDWSFSLMSQVRDDAPKRKPVLPGALKSSRFSSQSPPSTPSTASQDTSRIGASD